METSLKVMVSCRARKGGSGSLVYIVWERAWVSKPSLPVSSLKNAMNAREDGSCEDDRGWSKQRHRQFSQHFRHCPAQFTPGKL